MLGACPDEHFMCKTTSSLAAGRWGRPLPELQSQCGKGFLLWGKGREKRSARSVLRLLLQRAPQAHSPRKPRV